MTPTRTGAVSTQNSDKNVLFESVYGDYADSMVIASNFTTTRNCGGTNTTTGQASVYGTHFSDIFTSATVGRIVCHLNEPSEDSVGYTLTNFGVGSGFTSAGNVSISNVNDSFEVETPYYIKGHTGLSNVVPVVTGTNVTYSSGARWGNHDIYFKIDTGSGFGEWIEFNTANLNAYSTIDPSTGFRLRLRIVCAIASATNLITYIHINTTTSVIARPNDLYPLDVINSSISLTGLIDGTEVGIYRVSDMYEYNHVENVYGGVFTYNYNYTEATPVYIIIHHKEYQHIKINLNLSATPASIPIQQQLDRWYSNPA
jgi:hypothetical protein